MLQLNPPIPVLIIENTQKIPSGKGLAFMLIDYGMEHHIIWGVALDRTGEVWWPPNPLIRLQANFTANRLNTDEKQQQSQNHVN